MNTRLWSLLSHPFWLVVGLWITALQLRSIARLLRMSGAQVETFIDEERAMILFVSKLNGCAALFAVASIALVVTLHFAGAF